MKVGIVGLPNVGKSTLFQALTRKKVDINNYPFCTIDPNVGVVSVPDDRLLKLAKMARSKEIVPAVVEFVDIAGLVAGAAEGEGLGNKFLSHIREVDAIAEVVRVFPSRDIVHIHEGVDPARDKGIVETELILADLDTAKRTIARLEKDARGGKKDADKQLDFVKILYEEMEKGILARIVIQMHPDALKKDHPVGVIVREMSLLTAKPIVYVYNIADGGEMPEEAKRENAVALDIKLEEELSEMGEAAARELGVEPRLGDLIRRAYDMLGLQTFFTTGEDESRAWTVRRGATAPEAGAAIHNDFRERFIRAEVIHCDKLLEIGSWSRARETGALRTEGKEYRVKDGDVMEFRI